MREIVRELAFVDPSIDDLDVLLAGLRRDLHAIVLDADSPAPAQMARALAGLRHLAAVHVIAHGAPGEINFAAGALMRASLDEHADDLAAIGEALGAADGQLNLWSCETAAGAVGQAFVTNLARATGAQVAASRGLVGAAAKGGAWKLDAATRAPLTPAGQQSYGGLMSITIDSANITSISPDDGVSQLDYLTDTNKVTVAGSILTSHGAGQGNLGIWVSGGSYGTANGGKGTLVGTVKITANGGWNFDLSSLGLSDDTYTIHITDGQGKGAPDLASHALTIDTHAPSTPVLALGAGVSNGATASEATAATGVVTVSGEAGSSIAVTFTNGTHTVTKTVTGTGAAQAVTLLAGDLGTLTDGTISVSAVATDAAGNASPAGSTSFVLDTKAPTVTAVTDNITASVTNGAINFSVTFSEAVSGVSASSFTATNGTVTGFTAVDSSHYTVAVTPTAGVQAGNVALSLVAAGAHDGAGNAAAAANLSGLDSQAIDTQAPTVTAVSAVTLTGAVLSGTTELLNAGDTVSFTLTMSEAVNVSAGSITLTNGKTATYQSGSPGNQLVFKYTVAGGDDATNPANLAVSSYSLTGTDTAGNPISLSGAPAPVLADSSGHHLTVDTTVPVITSFTDSQNNGNYIVRAVVADANGIQSVSIYDNTQNKQLASLSLASGTTTSGTWSNNEKNSGIASGDTITATVTDSAGNTATRTTTAPAGAAGSPIDLALNDFSTDPNGQVAVTVTGVPSDWTLNAGTKNANGTWTIHTNNPGSLSVTTPASFVGAAVLQVDEVWTNADGTTGSLIVADNVEAYAPGSPIFALSGDDNLTGSSGADTFVFSHPIAADRVYSFNAATDVIDLVGFSGFASFADVQAHTADNASGDAVITLGAGQSITLLGVDASSLSASDFVFNQQPTMANAGAMTIGDGAILPLGGAIDNTGSIALNAAGSETDLEVLDTGITLTGGGRVVLSDSSQNMIYGATVGSLLANVDNTISGAGQIGNGELVLNNGGTILANGSNALVIDTGAAVIANSGLIEATGTGGLEIKSALSNIGALVAEGGNLKLDGDVTGAGKATIGGGATLEFAGASTTATSFVQGETGTLKLDQSRSFTGTVSGLAAGDQLDFADISFGANTSLGYTANGDGTGGTLTVSDGTHSASIALLGQFAAAGFQGAGDNDAGTVITYTPPQQQPVTLAAASG
jgi:hypothetical protein